MTAYLAVRENEEPGVQLDAATLNDAKRIASQKLESGAFAGQRIRLFELIETHNAGLVFTGKLWSKNAHHKGKWTPLGDAI